MTQMVACPECGNGVNINSDANVSVYKNKPNVPDGYSKIDMGVGETYEQIIERGGTYDTRYIFSITSKSCPDGHDFYITTEIVNNRYS